MPKLLIFVPCERVIVSGSEGGDNTASLIAILEGVEVLKKVPLDAAVPKPWVIFSLWTRSNGDEDKNYEQICDMVAPSGKVAITSTLQFRFALRNHRINVHVNGLPIGEDGTYLLILYLQEVGKPETKTEYATFPISVSHELKAEEPEEPEIEVEV